MKKSLVIIAALICCISMVMFAACDPKDGTQTIGTEALAKKYEATADATTIVEELEIEKDGKLVYSLEKTLTKGEGGYTVRETEKTLNTVSVDNVPEEQYNETIQEEYTLKAATDGTATLQLKQEYFNTTGFALSETSLKGTVKDANVEDFLSIDEELPAEIKGLNVELAASETAVTSIKMSYTSEGYTVNITLTYTY